MAVSAYQDDAVGPGVPDEVEEPLPLIREVHPLLPVMFLREDLDAGGHDAQVGRFPQLAGQPRPLRLAEKGLPFAPGGRVVPPGRGRGHQFHEGGSKCACIQKQELDVQVGERNSLLAIDAGPLPARRGAGHAEEVEKGLGRLRLHRVVGPGVVFAVIVIVPGGEHGGSRGQSPVRGYAAQGPVVRADLVDVPGVRIDVVAEKQEDIGGALGQEFEQRRRLLLAQAGPEPDARHGGRVAGRNANAGLVAARRDDRYRGDAQEGCGVSMAIHGAGIGAQSAAARNRNRP